MIAALGIILIAAGAILAFATTISSSTIDPVAVGWILMTVGAIALLVWFAMLASFAPFSTTRTVGREAPLERQTVIREAPVERRTVIREEPLERQTIVREDPVDRRL